MRSFVIDGEPRGKGRPRFSSVNGQVRTRTPEGTVIYENLVRLSYQQQCGEPMYEAKVPIVMEICAFYAMPQNISRKKRLQMLNGDIRPTKKPDIDNLCKIIMDSLNKVAYYDDAQIVRAIIMKEYSDRPRVCVNMWTLEEINEAAEVLHEMEEKL